VLELDAIDLDAISPAELPAVLSRLAALQAAVLARLVQAAPAHAPPDSLLALEDAAARLGVEPNWIRRRPALPFRVQLSPGVVRYSATGIAEFIAAHRAGR
jgi:hypothetical protein